MGFRHRTFRLLQYHSQTSGNIFFLTTYWKQNQRRLQNVLKPMASRYIRQYDNDMRNNSLLKFQWYRNCSQSKALYKKTTLINFKHLKMAKNLSIIEVSNKICLRFITNCWLLDKHKYTFMHIEVNFLNILSKPLVNVPETADRRINVVYGDLDHDLEIKLPAHFKVNIL